MTSVTHHSDGTVTIRMRADGREDEEYDRGLLTTEQMVDYLKTIGYIVIDANHVAYCHYVSGECPHCGRPAERPSP